MHHTIDDFEQFKRGEISHDELLRRQREVYPRCARHNAPAPGIDDRGQPACERCAAEQDRLRVKSHGLVSGGYEL